MAYDGVQLPLNDWRDSILLHSKLAQYGYELYRGLTLGEADKQTVQRAGAGENSYRSSDVKVLAGLAAYPWALDSTESGVFSCIDNMSVMTYIPEWLLATDRWSGYAPR